MTNPLEQQAAQFDRQPGLCEALVAGASDAILAVDTDGHVVLWNDGCTELFGWTRAEMLGRPAAVLVPEDRRAELDRVMRALSGRTEPAALETVQLHKSGEVVPISCRISPILGEAGQVVGASALARDNSREIELRQQLERSRHLAEARFHQSVVPQATISADATIVDCNAALCHLVGYQYRQLLGRPLPDLVPDPDRAGAVALVARLLDGDLPALHQPHLLRHADGRLVETRMSIFAVRDDDGDHVLQLEVVIEDVSVAAAAQRELRLREARRQSLELYSADVGLFLDSEARLLFISAAALRQFGYRPEELVGVDGFAFVHPEDEPGVRKLWEAAVASAPGTTSFFELRVRHADGSWRWVEESVTNRLLDPDVGAMVVNLADISQRKSAEAVLEELAGMDALTGLATRAPLMATLDAAFAAGRAADTAVAVVDLDRFKLVNDVYGHRGGDDVLREVAARLSQAVGDRGVVARVGGDQFAVVLRDSAEISALFERLAELLAALAEPISVNSSEETVSVTASAGAALGPAVDSGALLASAESALATAKQGVTGPMHVARAETSSSAMFRARLIEDLRRGIAQDELVVHFQPVLSITDGRPVAAEALVRWNHPEKGLLSPAAFMEAAEDSGLITSIGQKVLREACAAATRWNDGRNGFYVAVNLSARQLVAGDVVAIVREELRANRAAPQWLMLEVTESAVMSDLEATVRTLQELRALGVAIAVDDFGTGYSSLTYLKRFPVTTLKIDRSFVNGLGTNNDDAAIVSSVISLARAMHLDCIAEGVETEQQRLVLQALGCGYGQGFLWLPAVSAEELDAWLGAGAPPASEGDRTAGDNGRPPESPPTRPRASASALTPDPRLLQRVLELTGEGASLATIAAALNSEQLLTAHGRRWTSRSVALMLATRQRG